MKARRRTTPPKEDVAKAETDGTNDGEDNYYLSGIGFAPIRMESFDKINTNSEAFESVELGEFPKKHT